MNLPSLDIIPRISNHSGHRVALGVMENLVMTLMDGNNTIIDIGDACGLEREMAQRIFKRLYDLHLVDLPGFNAPDAPPKPSSPPPSPSSQSGGQSTERLSAEGMIAATEEFFEKIGKVNLYDMLGVPPNADRKVIRSAYFSLSKKFHPDRAFGKDLGAVQPKMERIFHELTRAYDVLSNPNQRKAYDGKIAPQIEEWLKAHPTPPPADPAPAVASAPQTPAAPLVEPRKPVVAKAVAPAPVAPPEPVGVAPRAPVGRPEVLRAAAVPGASQDISRSLTPSDATVGNSTPVGGTAIPIRSSSIPAPRRSSIPPAAIDSAEAALRREQWKKERLQKALGGMSAPSAAVVAGAPKSSKRSTNALLDHARIALERQEFDEAIQSANSILTISPDHADAQAVLNKATEGKNRMKAAAIIKEGRLFQARGNMAEAIKKYEQALRADSDNTEARYLIATLLLELNQDFPRALTLTREILVKGGVKARYYALLGELMLRERSPARAIEAFHKASNLDPDNQEYKKRLKSIQGT